MADLDSLSLSDEIKNNIKEWISPEYDEETRNEIIELINKKDEKELTDRFFQDLKFGTGGLRGIIGAGTNRMNKYNVWKATQGLCFAKETALVMAGNHIKVFLFDSLRPTPMLSFAVRYLKAHTGIVITASHNPPAYNGYKVYWQDGGQIVPPHDNNIINHVHRINNLKQIHHMTEQEAKNKGYLHIIGQEVDQVYYEKVKSFCINTDIIPEVSDRIKIVYTPIHGAGNIPVQHILSDMGFQNVFIVKEQEQPDGDFPTVQSPNPEEESALKMGLNLCEKENADILIATDPDSDRFATAVKDTDNHYKLMNGNQIVSILSYYVLSQLKEKGRLPENGLIVKTIVTTDLIKKIADDFNIHVVETLTGFKYIGEQIKINENLKNEGKPYKQYIFGGEESYGMLAGDFVRDKDGIIASALFAEMAGYLKYNNKTVFQYMDEIYLKYGYYREYLKSLTFKGIEGIKKINQIMERFRNDPPSRINDLKLLKIGDILKGELINRESKTVEYRYNLPESNVLILFLEKNIKISMRPSGTEPKIKFYFAGFESDISDLKKVKQEVDIRTQETMNKFLEMVN